MIKDQTIDQAIVECLRTLRALQALRAARKASAKKPRAFQELVPTWYFNDQVKEHAAVMRASMDLTRKLADLRQSR